MRKTSWLQSLPQQPWLHRLFPVFVQNLGITALGYRRARTRYTPHFERTLRAWQKSVDGPLEALHGLQRQRLAHLVEWARARVPHYRELPPPAEARDPLEAIQRTLRSIPPLEKEVYRARADRLLARGMPRRRLIPDTTSGTTGTALALWHTPELVAEKYAAVWRQRRPLGIELRDPHISFGGNVIAPAGQTRPPFWRTNYYGNQTLFSLFHMSPHNLPLYVDAIHAAPARYAQGYPSALHLVGRAMLDAERPLQPGRLVAVFTSSETLLDAQRDVIERAFNAPVFDYYSAAENAVSLSECSQRRLHVDLEFCIVEVEVEEETDEIERGPLLVTGLGTHATPFLRYRIGDRGVRAKRPCPCGRPGDVFLRLEGRDEDYVMRPDGSLVGRLDHLFKDQLDLLEAQIVQETNDAVEIFLVPRPGYGRESERKLLRELRARLGPEMKVGLHRVASIPREPNGKFRAVKSRVGRRAR